MNISGGLSGDLAVRIGKFKQACGERVFDELARLNQMDVELLRRARAEVRRRFENVPDHEKKLRALEHRISLLKGRARAEELEDEPPAPSVEKAAKRPPAAVPLYTRITRTIRALPHLRAMRTLFDARYYVRGAARFRSRKNGGNPIPCSMRNFTCANILM